MTLSLKQGDIIVNGSEAYLSLGSLTGNWVQYGRSWFCIKGNPENVGVRIRITRYGFRKLKSVEDPIWLTNSEVKERFSNDTRLLG